MMQTGSSVVPKTFRLLCAPERGQLLYRPNNYAHSNFSLCSHLIADFFSLLQYNQLIEYCMLNSMLIAENNNKYSVLDSPCNA